MAFFDKVSEFAKTAADRTGDAVESTKLNAKISKEEKNIEAATKLLGEFYLGELDNGTPVPAGAQDAYAAIQAARANIAQAKADIEQIKAENAAEAAAKAAPVAPQPAAQPAAAAQPKAFCTSCGAVITPGAAFCGNCGAKQG
ncbi:MAG: zinc ribbon domain-containing protein [Eubacteriales bacterium]|nr:zinc ribbon domain-containing protein [Eubacteriales bacterium]